MLSNLLRPIKSGLLPLYLLFFLMPLSVYSQVPVIDSFNPGSGKVNDQITISGANFSVSPSDNIVFFGATRATVLSSSGTQLVVKVPEGATARPVSVTVNALTCYSKNRFMPTFEVSGPYVPSALEAPINFSGRVYPAQIILKDIDGDGKSDIVVANSTVGAGMSILRNTNNAKGTIGANSFANRIDIESLGGSRSFAVEDFNGDGKPDVVNAGYYPSALNFLLNTSAPGNIKFSSVYAIPTDEYVSNLTIADMNADGKPDIITVSNNNKKISILINTSVGNTLMFSNQLSFESGTFITGITCQDLDGDAKADLIVNTNDNNSGGGSCVVYLNTTTSGSASFGDKIEILGVQNSPVEIGDMDGDGRPDLVLSGYGGYYVCRNNSERGKILFADKQIFAVQLLNSISIGEIDGDGKPDIILNGNSISKNTSSPGTISFAPAISFNLGLVTVADVGDVDGDGKADLIGKIYDSGVIAVFRNKINEPAITSINPEIGLSGTRIEIKGYNLLNASLVALGNTPVASFTINSSTSISATVGAGSTGNVTAKTSFGTGTGNLFYYSTPPPLIESFLPKAAPIGSTVKISGKNFNPIAAGNIVFFGVARAQVTSADSNELVVLVPAGADYQPITVISNGLSTVSKTSFAVTFPDSGPITATTFGKTFDMRTFAYPGNTVIADMDLDGKTDLIVNSRTVFSFFKNSSSKGNVAFAERQDFNQQKEMKDLVAKDIDGDGKPDILYTTASSLVILKNISVSGSLAFATPVVVDLQGPGGIAVADYDNDGRMDVALAHSTTKQLTILRNTSNGFNISFAAALTVPGAIGSLILEVDGVYARDLNNDGLTDLVTMNSLSANQGMLIYQNVSTIGRIAFKPVKYITASYHPMNVVLQDLDGDGMAEIISVTNYNRFDIFKNTGTTEQLAFSDGKGYITGYSPSGMEVGDADGDGIPDLILSDGNMPGYTNVYKNLSSPGNIILASPLKFLKTNITSNTQVIGLWYSSAIICDFDGDGKPEICGSNGQGATISVSTNLINGPAVESFEPLAAGAGTAVKIKGANFNEIAEVKFGESPAASFKVESPTLITAIVGSGASGNVTVTNSVYTGALGTFKFLPAATITSFSPMAATYGETVLIKGTNFNEATQVTFGGIKAKSFYIISDSQISAVVDMPSASGSLSVTVPAGTVSAEGFVYAPVPVISSFRPLIGDTGTSVDIEGLNFSDVADDNIIYFGATKAKVNTASTTKLNVTVPVGAAYQPIGIYTGKSSLTNSSPRAFNTTFLSKNAISSTDFSPKVDFSTTASPQAVVAHDVDGDGKPDLAIANGVDNTISIYKNAATPGSLNASSYANAVTLPAGKGAQQIAFGDLDGDGQPDMVVVNFTDNSVYVYRNISTPGFITFEAPQSYVTGSGPYAICIADIDKDGKAEIVTANFTGNNISIFQNQSNPGNFVFKAKLDLATAIGPKSVAIADRDGDGKPEIITANFTGGNLSFFKNISTRGIIDGGSFEKRYEISTAAGATSVLMADVNQDGIPEVIVANEGNNSLSIISNFTAYDSDKIQLVTGNGPKGLQVADVDGDGQPDIVVANAAANTVSVFRNTMPLGSKPLTSFATKIDLAAGTTPSAICLSDVDGDGKVDVITSNSGNNTFSVMLNHPTDAILVAEPPKITSVLPAKQQIGSDIIIKGKNFNLAPNSNIVYFGATKAKVSATTATEMNVTIPSGTTYQPVTVLDAQTRLLGSSNLGYSTTFTSKNELTVNDMDAKIDFVTGTSPSAIAAGDLDGDGKADLVVANFAANTISVYRNTSTSGSINTSSYAIKVDFATGTGPQIIKLADLDGDGKLDIIVSNKTANSISLIRNLSNSGVINAGSFAAKTDLANANAESLEVGDIDGDGKPEVIGSGYTLTIYLNRTNTGAFTATSFAQKVEFPLSSGSFGSLVLSDMNNDGKKDVIVNCYGGFEILINDSKPSFLILNNRIKFSDIIGADRASVAVADVDDDGKTDIILASDKILLLRNKMTGNELNSSSFEASVSFAGDQTSEAFRYSATMADMDGDGKIDILYSANGLDQVAVFRNISTDVTPTNSFFDRKINYTGGNRTWGSIAIDVDGDGRSEIIYINQGNNTISILRNNPKPNTSAIAPVITSISPFYAPVGSVVTIKGNNFSTSAEKNMVSFGGVPAVISTASTTEINVKVPVGTAYGQVAVVNKENNLTGYAAQKFSVSFSSKKDITKKDFDPPATITSYDISSVKSADIDGDGKSDLLILSQSAVAVARNIGSQGKISKSSFDNLSYIQTGEGPQAITVADVDGDGKPDVMTTYYSFEGIGVSVAINSSSPGKIAFAKTVNIPYASALFGPNNYKVDVNDVDGDGKPELIIANSTLKGISIFKNDCTPGVVSFTKQYNFEAGRGSSSVNLADLDNDGKPDLVITNKFDNTISVLKNVSPRGVLNNASFARYIDFQTATSPLQAIVGDLNADGKPDIVVATEAGVLSVFENTGNKNTISSSTFSNRTDIKVYAKAVEIADMDGDDYPDIVIAGGFSPTIIRNVSGSGKISRESFADNIVSISTTDTFSSLAIADVDGDGKADIIAGNNFDQKVFRNNPQPADAPKISSFSPSSAGSDVLVTILGSDFVNVTEVTFGGAKARSFIVVSPTKINAIVGDGQSGEIAVKTETGLGSLIDFTYIPAPVVSAFSPAGAIRGTKIAITGRNFTNATSVTFGGVNAASFNVVSDTEISAFVAEGASGDIGITTPGGTAALGGFSYFGKPFIASISQQMAGEGNTINITGSNFTGATAVTFGGVNASSFTIVSSTAILAKLGKGASGNIEITTPGGTGSFAGFQYVFLLPTDNFKIASQALSCKGSKNGAINISAKTPLNYIATLTSNGISSTHNFASTLDLNNLNVGNYNLCITIPDQPNYKQCYDVVISEPKELSLYTNISTTSPTVTISLSGANTYFVDLNGKTYQTTNSELNLPLASGINKLMVSSDMPCQGVIKKTLVMAAKASFSPNPVEKILTIGMGDNTSSEANIEIFSLGGQRVFYAKRANEGYIEIDIEHLIPGMYVIKVSTANGTITSKILKK